MPTTHGEGTPPTIVHGAAGLCVVTVALHAERQRIATLLLESHQQLAPLLVRAITEGWSADRYQRKELRHLRQRRREALLEQVRRDPGALDLISREAQALGCAADVEAVSVAYMKRRKQTPPPHEKA